MCIACYLRECRGTALPEHACCFTCKTDNPLVLVRTGSLVSCYNCRAIARAQVA